MTMSWRWRGFTGTANRPRRAPGPIRSNPIYDPLPLLVQEPLTHFTLPMAVSDAPLPVAVSVTVRFPFAVKLCVGVAPLPVLPSPKFHANVLAFDDVFALKVQLRAEQVYVNLATGVGVEGSVTVTEVEAVLLPFASATVTTTE